MGSATESHAAPQIKKFEASTGMNTASFVMIAIGILTVIVGLINNPDRMWTSYLTAFFYVACLALGAFFFVTVNHLTKAGWSASIRRLAEGMSSYIPVMVVSSIVLLFGVKRLYPWADPEVVASNAMVAAKTSYLNGGFMAARMLLFGVGAWIFSKLIIGHSLQQDKDGLDQHTHKNLGLSIAYILFFAIFFSLYSVDLLMSLLPTWYSTIFGIYTFAGSFQSALAFLILLIMYMRNKGFVQGYFWDDHMHDVGKFLKAFTVFWAYIAFCQFMLIWYANIPEETEFFLMRSGNSGWMMVSMSLLIFKFIVPFIALLPRWAKRTEGWLASICVLVLVMQYVDIYWLVYPNFAFGAEESQVVFGFYEVGLLVGFLGLFLMSLIKFFEKNNLVAIKDPRMHEALHHHVTY